VADQNPAEKEKIDKELFERPIKGNGVDPSASGNGAHPHSTSRHRTLGQVAEIIRKTAAAHPDWSPKKIARETGQPEARVKKALGWPNGGAA
jgi:hypothetical protein